MVVKKLPINGFWQNLPSIRETLQHIASYFLHQVEPPHHSHKTAPHWTILVLPAPQSTALDQTAPHSSHLTTPLRTGTRHLSQNRQLRTHKFYGCLTLFLSYTNKVDKCMLVSRGDNTDLYTYVCISWWGDNVWCLQFEGAHCVVC